MKRILVFTFVAVILLAGVYPVYGASPFDFFPYKKGETIEFGVIRNAVKGDTTKWTCQGIELVNGKEVFAIEISKIDSHGQVRHGVVIYYLISKNGLARIGYRSPGKDSPTIFNNPDYYLKAPIRVGTSWKSKNTRKPGEIFKIISDNETVLTSAGWFSNCVKVESQYQIKESSSKSTKWYCPDIGLVKVVTIIEDKPKNLTHEFRRYLEEYIKR